MQRPVPFFYKTVLPIDFMYGCQLLSYFFIFGERRHLPFQAV